MSRAEDAVNDLLTRRNAVSAYMITLKYHKDAEQLLSRLEKDSTNPFELYTVRYELKQLSKVLDTLALLMETEHMPEDYASLIKRMLSERNKSVTNKTCPPPPFGCGKPWGEFKDALSLKEASISGLCQECQNYFETLAEEINDRSKTDDDESSSV